MNGPSRLLAPGPTPDSRPSAERGPLAIGKHGAHFLRDGTIDGEDPLTPFGPHAARHLRREAEFPNVPDILVISSVDPVSGEVPAFEELVGNHAGLAAHSASHSSCIRPSSTPERRRSSAPATCTTS